MKNTQNKNKVEMTPILKKKMLPYKIALSIIIVILLAILISWFILAEWFTQPYFYEHFAGTISLVLIGLICLILPMANSKRIAGDSRGDSLMIGLGFGCFILAIVTLILSFTGLLSF